MFSLSTISFTKSSDDQTAEASLVYEVYYRVGLLADASKLDSVANALANGQMIAATVDDSGAPLTATIEGLAPSTNYVFTILVKDSAGNRSVYQPMQATTAADATPPVPGVDGLTYLTGATAPTSLNLSWGKAADLGTPATALKYSVYYDPKDALDLVSDMESYGILANSVGGDADIGTFALTGLNPSTPYLLNLFVEDQLANKAAYRTLQVTTPPHFVAIAGGGRHSCALTGEGKAYCWGYKNSGNIGDGTGIGSGSQGVMVEVDRTNVDADAAGTFVQIGAGDGFSCALTSKGLVYCWGFGDYGSRADGTTDEVDLPTKIDDSGFTASDGRPVQLTVGFLHACVLMSSGKTYCWGYGWPIDAINTDKLTPVAIETSGVDGRFKQLSAGKERTCGLSDSGKAYCWGAGETWIGVGDGTTSNRGTPTLVDVSALPAESQRFTDISAAISSTCAVAESGKLFCWGYDNQGQIGNGDEGSNGTSDNPVLTPVEVSTVNVVGDKRFVKVRGTIFNGTGGHVNCAVTVEGRLYCWGDNGNSYLTGTSTTAGLVFEPKPINQAVLGAHGRFRDISLGYNMGCALTVDGAVRCWGEQTSGRLGNNQTASANLLMTDLYTTGLAGSQSWTGLFAGGTHSCGLASQGGLFCWGNNASGQVGVATLGAQTLPQSVDTRGMAGRQQFLAVGAGTDHSCGVSADGIVHCWGDDASGQLGNGTAGSTTKPTAVSSSDKFVSVTAGDRFSCAISSFGSAQCWGEGSSGQLGTGATTDAVSPAAVSVTSLPATDQKFVQLAAGSQHACGISGSGNVLCWGAGAFGQIGDGASSTAARLSPTAVSTANVNADGNAERFRVVAAGRAHSCALTTNGKVYCWGDNTLGQLGINSSSTPSNAPVQIHMGDVGAS